jgi:mono/diheme cytochrome c family protein
MALWKKVLIGLVVIVGGLFVAFISATVGWQVFLSGPRARPLTDRRIEATPERLERGRYLVEARHGCLHCHSPKDATLPGMPVAADKAGAGLVWSAEGMPWLTAPNLTPDPETGLGQVPDDAIARAVREGIGHDGRALFPLMPYEKYRRIPDDDMAAIVVYLRSLRPVKNPLPKTVMPQPMRFFIQAVPQPLDGPVPAPDLSTPEKRGEYLVSTIECAGCHTPRDAHGQIVPGLDLAGGAVFPLPGGGTIATTNLTPDASGIPYYDEALFVEAMRTGRVRARELNPAMPWIVFGKMDDTDLKAIFAYLKTLPPAHHAVSNQEPPTACKRCGNSHGLGDRN